MPLRLICCRKPFFIPALVLVIKPGVGKSAARKYFIVTCVWLGRNITKKLWKKTMLRKRVSRFLFVLVITGFLEERRFQSDNFF